MDGYEPARRLPSAVCHPSSATRRLPPVGHTRIPMYPPREPQRPAYASALRMRWMLTGFAVPNSCAHKDT